MNAGKVSEDIKDAIAYNNARSVNVALSCKDEEGSLFPQPTYQAKLGYAFEVQFIPNTQNFLITDPSTMLKAVSRINDESRAEYVEFTPVEQSYEDQKSGLYRVNVKIVKYADDIKICPNGTLIPKVKEIYPPYNPAGYSQDSVIRVTFNKPVNPQSFGDFSCISFESGSKDISSCYGTPYFSSDNTVLFIPPVPGKKIIDEQSQNNAAEVTLKINCANLTDADGLSIPQIDSYTYCVNKTVDSIAPVITYFSLTTTGDTNACYYRSLTNKAFSSWSSAEVKEDDGITVKYYYGDYSQNHVGNSVHISLKGYDNADLIYGVRIKESLLKIVSGSDASSNEIITYYDNVQAVIDESGNAVLTNEGKVLYSFDFDYEFKSKMNGLVFLEISLMDGAGKTSTKENYYVIKMSATNRDLNLYLEVDPNGQIPQFIDGKYKSHICVPAQNSYGQNVTFSLGPATKFFGNYISTCSSFELLFYDENNNPIKVFEKKNFTGSISEVQNIKAEVNLALADVLVDSYRDTKAKAVFYEANGMTTEYDFIIPAAGEITTLMGGTYLYTTKGITEMSYVTYKVDEDSQVSKTWQNKANQNNVNFSSIISKTASNDYPFGIYTIYAKDYEDPTKNITIKAGYTKPYVYVKTTAGPEIFTVNFSKKSAVYDSSLRKHKVTINVTYPEDEYLYYILASSGGMNYLSEERADFIYLPSRDDDYYLMIAKKHPEKGFIGTSQYSLNINKLTASGGDIYPPRICYTSWDDTFHYYDASYLYFNNFTIVNNKNKGSNDPIEEGPVSFVCYYLPLNVGKTTTLDVLESQCVYKKTIEIKSDPDPDNVGKLCAIIPFSDIEKGEYYLYAYLTDANGNTSCERFVNQNRLNIINNGVHYLLTNKKPSVKMKDSTFIEILDPDGNSQISYESNGIKKRMYRYMLKQDAQGKWFWEAMEEVGSCYGWTNADNGNDNKKYTYEQGHFMKVLGCDTAEHDSRQLFDYAHFMPLYYYPNYVKSPSSYPCNSATWMKVANGWQIFRDAPVFVHTMYSAIKITETNGKDESLEWEARAHETGIVVYTTTTNTNFTYKDDNLAEIPDNNWYTTICHFADGTVLMSPVEQMHK